VLFTFLYFLVGHRQLQGLLATTEWGKVKEIFFFSTETFTTVGYGRINPVGDGAHIIASLECMCGVVSFALVTGLLYGRFTRPKAYLAFTRQALISPYKGAAALMFRMVPYKENHLLTDARVVLTVSLTIMEEEQPVFKFYELKLERSHVDTFNMNWTVVHPIDQDSPLLNFTLEDMQQADMEVYVLVSGFDPLFSNTVMQRTSYTYKEVVWGGKFRPMYHESADGSTTIVDLDKLEEYEQVELLQAAV
jgi:inward rectifier potassium channel